MPVTDRPTLQLGSEGPAVRELQTLLNQRLAHHPTYRAISVDGSFKNTTANAVRTYQAYFTLPQDGVVGPSTWASLLLSRFLDIQGHWAGNYIVQLANVRVVQGDDLGKFNPDQAITRAQYAALMVRGFDPVPVVRPAKEFPDVPRTHWAYTSVRKAYQAGYLSGLDDGTFKPDQNLLRRDAIISLANAIGTRPDGGLEVLNYYTDASTIPDYARRGIALATLYGIVVNFPTVRQLNPNRAATRAEITAMVSRGNTVSVERGRILNHAVARPAIGSPYVVIVG
jgi:hypothetical protein